MHSLAFGRTIAPAGGTDLLGRQAGGMSRRLSTLLRGSALARPPLPTRARSRAPASSRNRGRSPRGTALDGAAAAQESAPGAHLRARQGAACVLPRPRSAARLAAAAARGGDGSFACAAWPHGTRGFAWSSRHGDDGGRWSRDDDRKPDEESLERFWKEQGVPLPAQRQNLIRHGLARALYRPVPRPRPRRTRGDRSPLARCYVRKGRLPKR